MVLLQSLCVNVTIKYFQLSIRSDACVGWVWLLTELNSHDRKQKRNTSKSDAEYTYLFPDLSKQTPNNILNGFLRPWISRILPSIVTHDFNLQMDFLLQKPKLPWFFWFLTLFWISSLGRLLHMSRIWCTSFFLGSHNAEELPAFLLLLHDRSCCIFTITSYTWSALILQHRG